MERQHNTFQAPSIPALNPPSRCCTRWQQRGLTLSAHPQTSCARRGHALCQPQLCFPQTPQQSRRRTDSLTEPDQGTPLTLQSATGAPLFPQRAQHSPLTVLFTLRGGDNSVCRSSPGLEATSYINAIHAARAEAPKAWPPESCKDERPR